MRRGPEGSLVGLDSEDGLIGDGAGLGRDDPGDPAMGALHVNTDDVGSEGDAVGAVLGRRLVTSLAGPVTRGREDDGARRRPTEVGHWPVEVRRVVDVARSDGARVA